MIADFNLFVFFSPTITVSGGFGGSNSRENIEHAEKNFTLNIGEIWL